MDEALAAGVEPFRISTPLPPIAGSKYVEWESASVRYKGDKGKLIGQNNKNPAGAFDNHAVVKIGGKYYDPSYGAIHPDLFKMQESMAGLFFMQQTTTGWVMFVKKFEPDYWITRFFGSELTEEVNGSEAAKLP